MGRMFGATRRRLWILVTASIVFAAFGNPVSAETVPGCYVRNYDRAHLARHPDQLVTNVRLSIRTAARDVSYAYEFMLQLALRGRSQPLRTVGLCKEGAAGRLHCYVECDGGGVDISIRPDSLMMHLDRIRMATCDKAVTDVEKSEDVSGGIDDRDFRLDRAGGAVCQD